jgi:hypothetical protein
MNDTIPFLGWAIKPELDVCDFACNGVHGRERPAGEIAHSLGRINGLSSGGLVAGGSRSGQTDLDAVKMVKILVDRRCRPLIERAPGHTIGVPARIRPAEMWKRRRSAIYLDNPIDRLPPTEDEWIDRAEMALQSFGIETGELTS